MWKEKATKGNNLSVKHNKSLHNNKYHLTPHNKYQFILLADQTSTMTEKYIKTAKLNKKLKSKKKYSS